LNLIFFSSILVPMGLSNSHDNINNTKYNHCPNSSATNSSSSHHHHHHTNSNSPFSFCAGPVSASSSRRHQQPPPPFEFFANSPNNPSSAGLNSVRVCFPPPPNSRLKDAEFAKNNRTININGKVLRVRDKVDFAI